MFLLGSGSGFQIFLDSVFSISNFLGELCPKLICDAVAFRIDAVCNKNASDRNKSCLYLAKNPRGINPLDIHEFY